MPKSINKRISHSLCLPPPRNEDPPMGKAADGGSQEGRREPRPGLSVPAVSSERMSTGSAER